ncbi:MAG: GTP pyrophosphokinase family protein [Clostridia bacterium]|nr:GTP pyrophosphokinase family protein [Clostridia bacterium]MBR6787763.1 GTP pyrophosphokinase family protein [Clostridia bacterium]
MEAFINQKSAEEIKEMIDAMRAMMSYYRCAMLEIETKFKVLNEQFSLQHERNPIESIKCREKSIESIQEKLSRKGLPLTMEAIESNLNDVAGVRVICSFVDDIYMLADCLLQQDDVRLIERKDYIKNPKPNGYRSLHLIVEVPVFLQNEKKMVRAEVQLRTIAMELWANLEHRLRYKKELSEDVLKRTALELAECAMITYTLDEKMQRVRDIIEK